MIFSKSHLLLLPTYDTGPRLIGVVTEALARWQPVMVVDDGSMDGSLEPVKTLAARTPGLTVLTLPFNQGKGAAVLAGAKAALSLGYTHALVMDADGQHPSDHVGRFMEASQREPAAMILGVPQFGPEAPAVRVQGRKLSQLMVRLETLGPAIGDPLFGFRVYPLQPLVQALGAGSRGRGYDFDTEAAVRLFWAGVKPVNLEAPVRYFSRNEGGVSHFHYLRDNLVLFFMHVTLLAALAFRWFPAALRHRRRLRRALAVAAFLGLGLGPLQAQGVRPAPPEIARPAQALDAQHLDPFWLALAFSFSSRPSVWSGFTEERYFAFRRKPALLKGEVRIDPRHGLSLHYTSPQERILIMDDRGLLVREGGKDRVPPADPRGSASTDAMLDILRLDFAGLARSYALYGLHSEQGWELELAPQSPGSGAGTVYVMGSGSAVTRIVLEQSEKQRIDIAIDPPHEPQPFTASVIRRYFR